MAADLEVLYLTVKIRRRAAIPSGWFPGGLEVILRVRKQNGDRSSVPMALVPFPGVQGFFQVSTDKKTWAGNARGFQLGQPELQTEF